MILTMNGKQRRELRQDLLPVRIVKSFGIQNAEGLLLPQTDGLSFRETGWTVFAQPGSFLILDFGKELCGGIRMIVKEAAGTASWRLTFGESLTEACSSIGEKNATNAHSLRDFRVQTPNMSDCRYGQTGFRFVRIELVEAAHASVQAIMATSVLPLFDREAEVITNDPELNEILQTAAYTLKLCFQNGQIWDGIKRDRLVWCGDMNPELLASLYWFGATDNIPNSLDFLRASCSPDHWINLIPSYSAWWVINLCDYCRLTGRWDYFRENRDYALQIIRHFCECISDEGELVLRAMKPEYQGMAYFLDWSTVKTQDAPVGIAALVRRMAQKYRAIEANDDCSRIVDKLSHYVTTQSATKPVRAFQVLAGRERPQEDAAMLQAEGAKGFSTFMAYYILTAIAETGGTRMLPLLKEYYGGMLSRGATTFWEDFDITWLEGSGRIDMFPEPGQKDLHGDFGKHCYQQFRHSLCHGWSAGVLAFVVEYILGIHIEAGGKQVRVCPNPLGLTDIEARIPLQEGFLQLSLHGDELRVTAPEGVELL